MLMMMGWANAIQLLISDAMQRSALMPSILPLCESVRLQCICTGSCLPAASDTWKPMTPPTIEIGWRQQDFLPRYRAKT